jgi:hypothetical protein
MKTHLKSEKGMYHVMMTILLVPLLGVIALAVDGFLMMNLDVQQDSNAEYAALAAVRDLAESRANSIPNPPMMSFYARVASARAKAEKVANSNFYLGNNHEKQLRGGIFEPAYGEIIFGHVDTGPGVFVPCEPTAAIPCDASNYNNQATINYPEAVQVNLRTNSNNSVKSMFAQIVGKNDSNGSAKSIAYVNIHGVFGILR